MEEAYDLNNKENDVSYDQPEMNSKYARQSTTDMKREYNCVIGAHMSSKTATNIT